MNDFHPRQFPAVPLSVAEREAAASALRQATTERRLHAHRIANLEAGHQIMADRMQAIILAVAELETRLRGTT